MAHSWLTVLACVSTLAQAQNLQVTGTALVVSGDSGSSIDLVELPGGQSRSIVDLSFVSFPASLRTACFSPDGRFVAFSEAHPVSSTQSIYTMSTGGSGLRMLCQLYNTLTTDYLLTWSTDGHIYWSEWTDYVYRVDVVTGRREVFRTMPYVSKVASQDGGSGTTGVVRLKTSIDGTRGSAISKGLGHVFALDLAAGDSLSAGEWFGCQGTISASGEYLVRGVTTGHADWPEGMELGFQSFYTETFSTRSTLQWYWAPGQPDTPEDNMVHDHLYAVNSDSFLVCTGYRAPLEGRGFVYDLGAGDYVMLDTSGGQPSAPVDFWLGPLPTAPSPLTLMAQPTHIAFATVSSAPLDQDVTVQASGPVSADSVQVLEDAAWLNVMSSVTGEEIVLTNQVDPAGLADGACHATVTVYAGDLATVNYEVALTVGDNPAAPSLLSVRSLSNESVLVRWVDNSDDEDGFGVACSTVGGNWTSVGTVGADTTEFLHDGLTRGCYWYRVQAVRGGDVSGFTPVDMACLTQVIGLTLTWPTGGEQFAAGDTVRVSWEASGTGAVTVEASFNNGEDWFDLTEGEGVTAESPDWASFPWVIPDSVTTQQALVRVADYLDGSASDQSGQFTITPEAGVAPSTAGHLGTGYPVLALTGSRLVAGGFARNSLVAVSVHDVSGRLVHEGVYRGVELSRGVVVGEPVSVHAGPVVVRATMVGTARSAAGPLQAVLIPTRR